MTEERSPVDQALDLFVYAPLGLLFSARQVIPELAEKGRQQLNAQVGMARLIGQYAVKQGTTEAEKALVKAREQAVARLGDLILNSEAGGGESPVGEPEPEPVAETDEMVPEPVATTDETTLEPVAPPDVAPPDVAPLDVAPTDCHRPTCHRPTCHRPTWLPPRKRRPTTFPPNRRRPPCPARRRRRRRRRPG